jgi:hypothetical protein
MADHGGRAVRRHNNDLAAIVWIECHHGLVDDCVHVQADVALIHWHGRLVQVVQAAAVKNADPDVEETRTVPIVSAIDCERVHPALRQDNCKVFIIQTAQRLSLVADFMSRHRPKPPTDVRYILVQTQDVFHLRVRQACADEVGDVDYEGLRREFDLERGGSDRGRCLGRHHALRRARRSLEGS